MANDQDLVRIRLMLRELQDRAYSFVESGFPQYPGMCLGSAELAMRNGDLPWTLVYLGQAKAVLHSDTFGLRMGVDDLIQLVVRITKERLAT